MVAKWSALPSIGFDRRDDGTEFQRHHLVRRDLSADTRGSLDVGIVVANILDCATSSLLDTGPDRIGGGAGAPCDPLYFRSGVLRGLSAQLGGTVRGAAQQMPNPGGGIGDPLTRVGGAALLWFNLFFVVLLFRHAISVGEARYAFVSV